MMELGLYFAVCNHMALETALEKVASIGYRSLELSIHTGGRFDVEQTLKDGKGRQLISLIEAAGLRVSAFNMSADGQLVLGPHHADTDSIYSGTPEEKIRYGTARMLLAAEVAHELAVPVVTGFTGCEDYSRYSLGLINRPGRKWNQFLLNGGHRS
jgi:sugar phosphate isomerase/epimerase